MANVRTRYPPSPTGPLHIGGARTALFNYLFAKQAGGSFVLRIEDTDRERSRREYEADICESLAWLGVEADEGPESGGEYGPYRQSERTASYTPYLERLLTEGNAFTCFHTAAELEAEKRELIAAKQNPVHRCEHREASAAEREKLHTAKRESIIRFKTPPGRTIRFRDLIRGEIATESDLLGDFSIAKDTHTPLYNFAVAIDDAEMQISHVIRGEDHISNTPKQILIQEALGLPLPAYAHVPLILAPDRSKLSKRHGATSVLELRDAGYLPEALVNFIALLGWNPGGERELFSMDELIAHFDLAKVQKSGAVFNITKLEWLNGEYIRKKTPCELLTLAKPHLERRISTLAQFGDDYAEQVVALEQPRLKKLSDIGEEVAYFFRAPDYDTGMLRWKAMSDECCGLAPKIRRHHSRPRTSARARRTGTAVPQSHRGRG